MRGNLLVERMRMELRAFSESFFVAFAFVLPKLVDVLTLVGQPA